jgi:hypothetical protein
MQHLNIERQPQNGVMAMFDTSTLSFDIAPAATFEDLAERLARRRHRHDGALISVAVKICSQGE